MPDVVFHEPYLYVFIPNEAHMYNSCLEEVMTADVELTSDTDSGGFVDPSLIVSGSELHLFYLPGVIGGDPAGCASYPCTKEIHSALLTGSTVAEGSVTETFEQISGNRAEITLESAGGASDPDIVALEDGSYLLYVSSGQNTLVFTGTSLTGEFVSPDGDETRTVSQNAGGVPSAIRTPDGKIWLYVTTSSSGTEVIRRAVSDDGRTPLSESDFTTVVNSDISAGFTSSTNVSSPSIIAWPEGEWMDSPP